ncbi:hypothetical protein [Brevundimonas denitrificans]|uniref:hypothetical protein n=1 Tax=Brevundimonas denitrificans TaxID=1443434 RepID=UPI00223B88E9|nr:hypothetical protein [Brevundimonas denitrificans]
MAVNFNHIAYEALEVCNAVSWDAVREAVAAAGLNPARWRWIWAPATPLSPSAWRATSA